MSIQTAFLREVRILAGAVAMSACLASVALAQSPSQLPLLNRNGGGVPPNVMVTLDDSGSMGWQHMPEDRIDVAGWATISNPVGSNSIIFDPADSYGTGVFFDGVIAGNLSPVSWQQAAMRSPDTNTIFYNPEIRYLTWAIATYPLPAATATNPAGRMANSPPGAAFKNPMNPVTGGTINLTAGASNYNSGTWCFSNTSNATSCGSAGSSSSTKVSHDPGVYFRLNKTVAGVYLNPQLTSSYTGFSINSPLGATYTKYPKRTDCVADTSASPKCTQAEERQNFANWFTYYRTRNLLARGSLSEAFATATNTFRVGFGRINKGTATVDGVSTAVIESNTTKYGGGGVRDFDSTRKAQFFQWVQDLPASGGTALPAAIDAVGQYFSRTDAKGPWTDSPGAAGNTVADNKTCRRSYNIMMTDGYWNSNSNSLSSSDKNSDNTDGPVIVSADGLKTYKYKGGTKPYADGTSYTVADYAMHYWKTDLQPSTPNAVVPIGDNISFWQNMTNFTIGLGVKGSLDPSTDLAALTSGAKSWPAATTAGNLYNVDDLWHAAVNSRGQYFSAKDPSELSNALSIALGTAVGGSAATAGVATASTVLEATNRKYVPSYISGVWSGEITAIPLDVNGQGGSAVWTASTKWPVKPNTAGGTDWNQRKIFTWDNNAPGLPQAVAFTWPAISAPAKAALGSIATTYTSKFVDFLRGDHSNEGQAAAQFRLREDAQGLPFVLGDFVNSMPVFLLGDLDSDYSRLPIGGGSYQTFLNYKASRLGVLFAGSNDGMLHGFKDSKVTPATDGQEVFAYVPRAVYPNLYKLADKTYGTVALPHQYFVDGPQVEADAFVRAPGATPGTFAATASWRNYLLGSLGAGGRAVYGLDVTDTANLSSSTVRWEISSSDDADMGYVMAPITTGVLPNGKWVAIFGNGNSSANGQAVLFVVDLETGAFSKLAVGGAGGNGLGGVAVQRDALGQILRVYAGDLQGNMWRMDYNASASSTGYLKTYQESGVDKAIFTAQTVGGVVQPITQPPILYDHSLGGTLVVFGTGQLFSSADTVAYPVQSLYGIWDKVNGGVLDATFPRAIMRSSLASRTVTQTLGANGAVYYGLSGSAVNWATQRGWVVDLSVINGLRTIFPPQKVTFELALISVVAPAQAAAVCQSTDGKGINFLFSVEQGSNPPFNTVDTNGDNVVNSFDSTVAGYATGADGINRVIYSSKKATTPGGSTSGSDGICGPGFYQMSVQNTSGQVMTCVRNPTAVAGPLTVKDRVQRRIINPPIR